MSSPNRFFCVFLSFFVVPIAAAQAAEFQLDEAAAGARSRAIARGVQFLRNMQNQDGSYSSELGPGITALVTTALLRQGIPEQDPAVAKGLRYLEQFLQDDGGIYQAESIYRNYETSLAMMCFAETKQERFAAYNQRARQFIRKNQWDSEEGHGPASTSYGGAGYGKHKRPDLSNTSFLIDALKSSGVGPDDEAMQRALAFVSRCQNLETEHNTLPFSNKIGDGGFYYTCAAGGSSQAGELENGGLRSYGSMTYAGLKSMIYAGVNRDDPRVKAAVSWIAANYDLDRNPGMRAERDGLFYYYHTFAKSLSALGADTIKDSNGVERSWRSDLTQVLVRKQKNDGSWVNDSSRWLEGDAELVTAYSLLALSYCK